MYNCASGFHNPLKWEQIERLGHDALVKYPMSYVLWYPSGSFKDNLYHHKLDTVLYHYLPAYLLDFVIRLSGKPPVLVYTPLVINVSSKRLQPFSFDARYASTIKLTKLWVS